MDPLLLGTLGGIGANVIGGVAGEIWAGEDDKRQRMLEEMAMQEALGLSAPTLSPIEAQQAESTMGSMPSDMGNKAARDAAIRALMEQGLSGGSRLEDKLTNANAQRTAGVATRQAQQGALADAARRGTGGGASTLQAQLLGGSLGADRAAQVGLQGASDARRAALQALQSGGGMAGQAEGQDAEREARRRESLDRFALFNAQQREAAQRFNAQQQQQQFDNQMAVNANRQGAYRYGADNAQQRGQRKRQVAGGMGQSVNQGFASYGAYGKGGR